MPMGAVLVRLQCDLCFIAYFCLLQIILLAVLLAVIPVY